MQELFDYANKCFDILSTVQEFKSDIRLSDDIKEKLNESEDSFKVALCKLFFPHIMAHRYTSQLITKFNRLGLLSIFIPELSILETIPQSHKHRDIDVFMHTMAILNSADDAGLIMKYCALFHDIGKPIVMKEQPYLSFHKHEYASVDITRRIFNRYEFLQKDDTELVLNIIRNHMMPHYYLDNEWSDAAVLRFVKKCNYRYKEVIEFASYDMSKSSTRNIKIKRIEELLYRCNILSEATNGSSS